MNRRWIVVFALLLVSGAYIHFVKPISVPLNRSFSEFPVRVGNWRMVYEDRFSKEILSVLRATDYMSRQYSDDQGRIVTLYLGYHGGGEGTGGIHSPKNCLPSSGWYLDSTQVIDVPVSGEHSINLVNSVMSKGTQTVAFYYWFQVRDWIVTDEYELKVAELWNSLTARRKDESFVRISTPVMEGENTEEVMHRFVMDFYPIIDGFLPS